MPDPGETTNAKVQPSGLIHNHCRSTYRTRTPSGYEPFSKVLCACTRIIDMEIQVDVDYPDPIWILVFDTQKDPSQLAIGAVPYLPPKLVIPGDAARARPPTEWIPFNLGVLVTPSLDQVLDIEGIESTAIISSYIRYSVKETRGEGD